RLSPDRFWWTVAKNLAGFVLLTSTVRVMAPVLLDVGRTLGVPERIGGWPVTWFTITQAGAASIVVILSLLIVLGFQAFSDRVAGPMAAAVLVPAGVLLAGTPDRWRTIVRYV